MGQNRRMMVSGRQVMLPSIEVSILEAGSGGKPMMFLHGFAGGKEDYAGQLSGLAVSGYHVVAPDLRGHGASGAPFDEASYSFEIIAADVVELVEVLGWKNFILVGHSMGGMVAQEVALLAGDRVSVLVLVDTSAGGLDMDRGPALAAVELVRTAGTERLATLIAAMGGAGPLDSEAARRFSDSEPGWVERGDANLRNASDAMYAAMLIAMVDRPDRREALASLTMPTLVMVGDQDEPFRALCEDLAAAIPTARLVVIPESGHTPMQEAAKEWSTALSKFLADLS